MSNVPSEEHCPFTHNQKYKRNIFLLNAVIFFNSLQFISPIIVPFFTIYGGLNFSQILGLQSFYLLSNIFSEIPLGAIADYISRKFSLILAFFIISIAILFFVAIPKFHLFVFGEILWGCAASLISGADKALLYNSLLVLGREKEYNITLGKLHTYKLLAFLLAAPIGSLFSLTLGIRETMILLLIPIGFALILSLFLNDPLQRQPKHPKSYVNLLVSGFQILFKKKELSLLFIDALIITVLSYHVTSTYQQKLILLEVHQAHFGWIFAVMLISEILFLNIHNFLIRIFTKQQRVILFAYRMIAGIGMLFLAFSSHLPFFCVGLVLVAGCGLTYWAISIGYWQVIIPNEKQSTVISTANMFNLILVVLLNLLIGYVVKINLSYVFVFTGLLLVLWSILSPITEDLLSSTQ